MELTKNKSRRNWGIGLMVFGWYTITFTSSEFSSDVARVAVDIGGLASVIAGGWIAFHKPKPQPENTIDTAK